MDVKTIAAAAAYLLWGDRDTDSDGPAVPGPLEECTVPTADIQQPLARPTLHLIQQVVVLIRLSLLKRQIGVAVVNPLGQVKQAAGREEPIDRRIAGYNRPPRLHPRRLDIGRYSGTRHAHSIFTQLLMSIHNAVPPNDLSSLAGRELDSLISGKSPDPACPRGALGYASRSVSGFRSL